MVDSEGFHVDIILTDVSDVPRAWRPYLVAPEVPKHTFSGRDLDAVACSELAPNSLADLSSVDPDELVPTVQEAEELQGKGRTGDLQEASAKLTVRLAVINKRLELERAREGQKGLNDLIDSLQNATNPVLEEAKAARASAVQERNAQQVIIDDPNSTAEQKRAARDAKQVAVGAIGAANEIITREEEGPEAQRLADLASAQTSRDAQRDVITALRAEVASLKALRS